MSCEDYTEVSSLEKNLVKWFQLLEGYRLDAKYIKLAVECQVMYHYIGLYLEYIQDGIFNVILS